MNLKYEIDEQIDSEKDLVALLLKVNFHIIGELDKENVADEIGVNPSVYISALAFTTFSIMHSLLKKPEDYRGMKKMIKSFFNTFVKSMKAIKPQYDEAINGYTN